MSKVQAELDETKIILVRKKSRNEGRQLAEIKHAVLTKALFWILIQLTFVVEIQVTPPVWDRHFLVLLHSLPFTCMNAGSEGLAAALAVDIWGDVGRRWGHGLFTLWKRVCVLIDSESEMFMKTVVMTFTHRPLGRSGAHPVQSEYL